MSDYIQVDRGRIVDAPNPRSTLDVWCAIILIITVAMMGFVLWAAS
ncbi:hypothetical protein [Rhodococcus sp. 14-2496-1d]|nr:hypothetical protein [Rhodococcus sp. 14-2496-1d]